jgi:signal transduction histidine kinase
MRSLFVKVFLWFWMATTLSGLALFLIGLATQTGPPAEHRRRAVEQWRLLGRQTLTLYGETAAALLERDGATALADYTTRIERATGLRILLVRRGAETLLDRGASGEVERLAARAADSGSVEADLTGTAPALAARTPGARERALVVAGVLAEPPPFGPPPPFPPAGARPGVLAEIGRFARGFGLPFLVTSIIGGLVCLGLAWRLTAPIRRLRTAAQRLASGDLAARVGSGAVRGRDEVAALGRDFDLMAARIEELMAAQRRLLRDISHELRSPLARLGVALGLARRHSAPETAAPLDRIEREAERLNALIGQLLTLTQLETGGDRIARGPVSLARLVRAIAADANFEAGTARCRVVSVVEEEIAIPGSEEMLRRAVENVVRNGVRYTAEQTQVEIAVNRRAGQTGDEALITVRDHGPGVPEAALPQLFLPFYRVADARDRQSGGTGIGLAIAERAVRLHGGTVSAANVAGGGLIVTILLPLTTP